jgi:uncharacterized protein
MSKGKGRVPVRTCVSCLAKGKKQDLVRFVLDPEGRPVRDESQAMEGRGAYTCKTEACMGGMQNSRKIDRAFRRFATKGSGRGSTGQGHIGGFNGKSQGL